MDIEKRVRKPNAKRAAETMNNISECMFDLVTKEDAIEAAVWAANERDKIRNVLTNKLRNIGMAAIMAIRWA